MKTRLKKLFALPMACLFFAAVLLPTARADVFQREVTSFCTVVVLTPSGPSEALAIGSDCVPAWNFWCTPKKCTAITVDQK